MMTINCDAVKEYNYLMGNFTTCIKSTETPHGPMHPYSHNNTQFPTNTRSNQQDKFQDSMIGKELEA